MNKGTFDGDLEEIKFVKFFNSNKFKFENYLNNFEDDNNNLWMVRVTTKQLSKLSDRKVFTRSDCYLVSIINQDISNILEENDFFLSEEILILNNLKYNKINYSGISIKMKNSKNFQILKLGPNSFFKLFNSYELGAGASLFCMKENELIKNYDLLEGWKTSINKMKDYFYEFTIGNSNFILDKKICTSIKNYSCLKIKETINNSKELKKKIFNGIDLYEEPYTALYFYHGDEIKELVEIPFKITTGSGRSNGNYTIVLKP